jgi:hypothetical protein
MLNDVIMLKTITICYAAAAKPDVLRAASKITFFRLSTCSAALIIEGTGCRPDEHKEAI